MPMPRDEFDDYAAAAQAIETEQTKANQLQWLRLNPERPTLIAFAAFVNAAAPAVAVKAKQLGRSLTSDEIAEVKAAVAESLAAKLQKSVDALQPTDRLDRSIVRSVRSTVAWSEQLTKNVVLDHLPSDTIKLLGRARPKKKVATIVALLPSNTEGVLDAEAMRAQLESGELELASLTLDETAYTGMMARLGAVAQHKGTDAAAACAWAMKQNAKDEYGAPLVSYRGDSPIQTDTPINRLLWQRASAALNTYYPGAVLTPDELRAKLDPASVPPATADGDF